MSRLFIELHLDEDTDVLIADLVRSRGFKVTTAQEAGQIGKQDDEQLAYALSQRSALLTHNHVHFEALAREYLRPERSIMVLSSQCVVQPMK